MLHFVEQERFGERCRDFHPRERVLPAAEPVLPYLRPALRRPLQEREHLRQEQRQELPEACNS